MSMIANLLRVTEPELAAYLQDSSLLEDRIYNDEVEDEHLTDIDKSWAGILFLLTGQTFQNLHHPLAAIFFSEQFIDEDQDLGYGPGHYVTPQQVKTLALELSGTSVQELSARFDPERMNKLGIYPERWEANNLDYLMDYFKTIQATYSTAAEKGQAIITFLN